MYNFTGKHHRIRQNDYIYITSEMALVDESVELRARNLSTFSSDLQTVKQQLTAKHESISLTSLIVIISIEIVCFKRTRLFHIGEPRHDKTNKMTVSPGKTQLSLGIRPD